MHTCGFAGTGQVCGYFIALNCIYMDRNVCVYGCVDIVNILYVCVLQVEHLNAQPFNLMFLRREFFRQFLERCRLLSDLMIVFSLVFHHLTSCLDWTIFVASIFHVRTVLMLAHILNLVI